LIPSPVNAVKVNVDFIAAYVTARGRRLTSDLGYANFPFVYASVQFFDRFS